MKVLFVGKKNDANAESAARHVAASFSEATIVFGARGDTIPDEMTGWSGSYIFSYLSPWIIPEKLIRRTEQAAINWHPGPPEYPGIGCTNFAIYNNERQFGITCHHMLAKVDTGKIVEVRRFPVLECDTVLSVTQKCYALILPSFYHIVDCILSGAAIPESDEHWKRKPYTRKELDALSTISVEMSQEEVERRIRATTYDRPWAFIELYGRKYHLLSE